jgi:Uma2 family endonuclease
MGGIEQVPRTALEVFKMLPEGTLCEVIDNVLYMSPAPTPNHQDVLGDIFSLLKLYTKQNTLGKTYSSPIDVFLDEDRNAVQPDILFIKTENLYIVKEKAIHGVPDLVIELLSSNRSHDTQRKYSLYEEKAVKEYIIIDPETKEVWQYVLQDGKFVDQPSQNGKININLLNFAIDF